MSGVPVKLLTFDEVAEHLQLKPRTVQGYLTSGQLRGAKMGNRWRVHPDDLQAFIAARMNVAAPPAVAAADQAFDADAQFNQTSNRFR